MQVSVGERLALQCPSLCLYAQYMWKHEEVVALESFLSGKLPSKLCFPCYICYPACSLCFPHIYIYKGFPRQKPVVMCQTLVLCTNRKGSISGVDHTTSSCSAGPANTAWKPQPRRAELQLQKPWAAWPQQRPDLSEGTRPVPEPSHSSKSRSSGKTWKAFDRRWTKLPRTKGCF